MEKSSKIASIALWGLSAISIVLFLIMFTSIDSESNPGAKAQNWMSINIKWAEVMFVLAALVAVGFAAVQMFSDKTKAKNGLFVVLLFAVIILVSYLMASNELPVFFGSDKFVADGTLTPSISRWIGTGLNATYITFAGAILSVAYFGVAKLFKR